MSKAEFYKTWIRNFVFEIDDLNKLEVLYDLIKAAWMSEKCHNQ